MIEVKSLLKNHPNFNKLVEILKNVSADPITNISGVLELSNVPFALHIALLNSLKDEANISICAFVRDSLETRKYQNTLEFINLKETSLNVLKRYLANFNFIKVLKVREIGEYNVSGDIVNFWPVGLEHPIRVSFFDEKFEYAEIYDEIYGKKYNKISKFFLGDIKQYDTKFARSQALVKINENTENGFVLIFGGDNLDVYSSKTDLNFDFTFPKLYFNRLDILRKDIEPLIDDGFKILIQTTHKDVIPNDLKKYLTEFDEELESGLISKLLKIIILTDREIFGSIFLNKTTKRLTSDKARKLLSELEGEISIGDYIVHEDHGIGVYQGITQEQYKQLIPLGFGESKTNIIFEDYILIKYAEGDELYVPLNQIDKITKFIGTDDNPPAITRLGKSDWNQLKVKVKKDIEIIAKELVSLYAKRELAKAPSINTNNDDEYQNFVNNFEYEETSDQIRTEQEVLFDLKNERPMNRLIVGDVGFGKTEVAMRAAFKVCQAGYQVAVLCPTTILTAQHEKVFSDRFANTKYKVASLSRLSNERINNVVKKINNNEVQVVIGTHRLLSSDVKFNNLGLLIIDEEQKFGVKQKEKLKQLHEHIHVLSMSATPIPRSLSMALSSIQEISLIQTPPKNRKSIISFVDKMDWNKITNAIQNEIKRDGQIYYLHNEIKTIQSIYKKLSTLLPNVRFAYAHGQMQPNILGKTVTDFYNHEFDCLICTTIIENGIDMPNVNTIVIEKAQNFGLGQLYQLRGRVGRSEKQAFAYFFYEGSNINVERDQDVLNEDGKILKLKQQKYIKRLKAVMENSELGSGFKIASSDLEIRGAGNLLGKQQHGNIKYMGYGLYMQLLSEEIEKMKNIFENQ